jgi:hypothetical protein
MIVKGLIDKAIMERAKVKLILRNGYYYYGVILNWYRDDVIEMFDKNGSTVYIDVVSISSLEFSNTNGGKKNGNYKE